MADLDDLKVADESPEATQREVEEIQEETQRIRERLPETVDELKVETERLLDWRHFVRSHPAGTLAAAAVLGYLAVPGKRVITVPAKKLPTPPTPAQRVMAALKPGAPKKPVVDALLATAGAMALKFAVGFATDRLGEYVTGMLHSKPKTRVEENSHDAVHPRG